MQMHAPSYHVEKATDHESRKEWKEAATEWRNARSASNGINRRAHYSLQAMRCDKMAEAK